VGRVSSIALDPKFHIPENRPAPRGQPKMQLIFAFFIKGNGQVGMGLMGWAGICPPLVLAFKWMIDNFQYKGLSLMAG
jgi:hypothetical protein